MQQTDWATYAIAGSCLSFLLCVLIQVLLWRFGRIRRQMLWLLLIHLAFPLAVFLMLAGLKVELPWLAMMALQASLGSAFVMTFPAVQAQSPSLEIVLWAWRLGGSRRQLLADLGKDARLLESRRKDLAADGLLRADGSLSMGGRLLAQFFSWYRKTMHVPQEQG